MQEASLPLPLPQRRTFPEHHWLVTRNALGTDTPQQEGHAVSSGPLSSNPGLCTEASDPEQGSLVFPGLLPGNQPLEWKSMVFHGPGSLGDPPGNYVLLLITSDLLQFRFFWVLF